jgi:L-gulonolactone oxidase
MLILTWPFLFSKVNFEKRFVHAQGGVTLQNLHAVLEAEGLAMINLGSISEQTLAGMMTTATHGTGIRHRVLSSHVQAVRLLKADGTKVTCSRDHQPDLFYATLCGLGSTGIILDIRMQVRPAFCLREVQETHKFNDVIDKFDDVAASAEFVRLWWWPQADEICVSRMNETNEVSLTPYPTPMRSSDITRQPKRPQRSWLWHSLVIYHVIECLLFLGIFLPVLNIWIGRFCSWLAQEKTVSIDDSLNLFNIDCKVRTNPLFPFLCVDASLPYPNSAYTIPLNGRCRVLRPSPVYVPYAPGSSLSLRIQMVCDRIAPLKSGSRMRMTFGWARATAKRRAGSESCSTGTSISLFRLVLSLLDHSSTVRRMNLNKKRPYNFNVPYRLLFERFERTMIRYEGRPHWAKAHGMGPDTLSVLYPKFESFKDLLNLYDPEGIFRNEYVSRHIFGATGPRFSARVFKARQ